MSIEQFVLGYNILGDKIEIKKDTVSEGGRRYDSISGRKNA